MGDTLGRRAEAARGGEDPRAGGAGAARQAVPPIPRPAGGVADRPTTAGKPSSRRRGSRVTAPSARVAATGTEAPAPGRPGPRPPSPPPRAERVANAPRHRLGLSGARRHPVPNARRGTEGARVGTARGVPGPNPPGGDGVGRDEPPRAPASPRRLSLSLRALALADDRRAPDPDRSSSAVNRAGAGPRRGRGRAALRRAPTGGTAPAAPRARRVRRP